MAHITILIPSLAGGGAQRTALKIAGWLARREHRVDIVLFAPSVAYPNDVPETTRLIVLCGCKQWARRGGERTCRPVRAGGPSARRGWVRYSESPEGGLGYDARGCGPETGLRGESCRITARVDFTSASSYRTGGGRSREGHAELGGFTDRPGIPDRPDAVEFERIVQSDYSRRDTIVLPAPQEIRWRPYRVLPRARL